jgi:aminoglycoside phosphotransferase
VPGARRRSPSADLALLTGPDALHLLGAALAPVGGTVHAWRPGEVTPRGGGITVRYHVEVRWADGVRRDEVLVASTGDVPRGALVLEDGDDRVAVWRFPHDPRLPALAAATNPDAVAALLTDLGLGAGPVELRTRAYRPGRRAVIEAVGSRGRLFLKVVRPARVGELHDRHRLLVERGVPAPQSLGWTPEGLLVLQALPGPTLRQLIGRQGSRLPDAGAITELLDRLPPEWASGPPGRSWLARVGHYAAVTSAVVPDQAARLAGIVAALEEEAGTGPLVAVHGDLYDSQILVGGGRITGLLDIDTIRPGDRLDDLACVLGHLSVLAVHDRMRAGAINRLGADYLSAFERTVDPADLRYRVAAVVVSLTTGPHRVQQANWEGATRALVGLAERWLDSARRVAAGSGR